MATPGDHARVMKAADRCMADVARAVEPVREQLKVVRTQRVEAFNQVAKKTTGIIHQSTTECLSSVLPMKIAPLVDQADFDDESLLGMRATLNDYFLRVSDAIDAWDKPDFDDLKELLDNIEASWMEFSAFNIRRDLIDMMNFLDQLEVKVKEKQEEVTEKLMKLATDLAAIPWVPVGTQNATKDMDMTEYLDAYLARHYDNYQWLIAMMHTLRDDAKERWSADVREHSNEMQAAYRSGVMENKMAALENEVRRLEAVVNPGHDTPGQPYADASSLDTSALRPTPDHRVD